MILEARCRNLGRPGWQGVEQLNALTGIKLSNSSLVGLCFLALMVPLAFGPVSAQAQETSSRLDGLSLSGDDPIQIESDKLQVQDSDGTAIFTGNVQVVQGKTLMKSGKMVVHYSKDDKHNQMTVRQRMALRSNASMSVTRSTSNRKRRKQALIAERST